MDMTTMLHDIAAVIFIVMIALPFVALGLKNKPADKIRSSLKFWKVFGMIANIALIVSFITGVVRSGGLFNTVWFWVVIVVYIAMGAFLGIAAKSIRLLMEGSGSTDANRAKLIRFSSLFSVLTVVMVVLMIMGPY